MSDEVNMPWRYIPTLGFFVYAIIYAYFRGNIPARIDLELRPRCLPCMLGFPGRNVRRPTWYERMTFVWVSKA